MMNDDNFDEIRKRLYDLESEPPTDGWDKIRQELDKPSDSLLGAYFKKHWWKPLVLLLPLIVYFLWPEHLPDNHLSKAEISGNLTTAVDKPEAAELIETKKVVKEKVVVEEESKPVSESRLKEVQRSNDLVNNQKEPHRSIKPTVKPATAENEPLKIIIEDEAENNFDEIDSQDKLFLNEEPVPVHLLSISTIDEVLVDSVLDSAIVEPLIMEESLEDADIDEPVIKQSVQNWKIFFSFSPQYIYNSFKPVANDEVLITSVNNQNENYPERIGYNISAGAGKEIFPKLYLEGKVSFNQLSDNISYTYSTGALDTLLKYYRADGIVEVTAIYDYQTKEIASKGIFGGIKLGATYYFLTNQKRGLHLSASAGINFLLNSQVSEKINGQWTKIADSKVENINYDLLVGLGYNRKIGRDIELMIMPTFIYYLNQNAASSQPFVIHQHAYGLQFMLSKYL